MFSLRVKFGGGAISNIIPGDSFVVLVIQKFKIAENSLRNGKERLENERVLFLFTFFRHAEAHFIHKPHFSPFQMPTAISC